ncbi:MAG: DUF2024 family protein [Saprospiraceae bacterium]
MQVAVWDTYVKKENGSVLHFDILVPETVTDPAVIFQYGYAYLDGENGASGRLETENCKLCHIETPTPEVVQGIEQHGYFIIDLGDIPAALPAEATRRDLILHLRGHYPQYRFADFMGKSEAEVREIVAGLTPPPASP